MLFNSFQFAYFLAIFLPLYWILRHRWQNVLVLAASYVFYASWNPKFLALLIQDEVARREQKKFSLRLRRAAFRATKTLEQFDFERLPQLNRALVHDLATGRYLGEKTPVLIVGPCGTGKSHLAQALGHCAVRQGADVVFTTCASLVASLNAALGRILDEGLEAVWTRHEEAGRLLQDGLEELGLELFAQKGARLPELTTVKVPDGIDSAAVRKVLLERHGIEIGAGAGAYAASVWRIGLMGHNARPDAVLLVLAALREVLGR